MFQHRRPISICSFGCALILGSVTSLTAGTTEQTVSLGTFDTPQIQAPFVTGFDDQGGTLTLTEVRLEVLTSVSGAFTTNGAGGTATYTASASVDLSLASGPLISTSAGYTGTVDNSGPPLSALLFDGSPEEVVITDAAGLAEWLGPDVVTMTAVIDFSSTVTPAGVIAYSSLGSCDITVTYEFENSPVGESFERGDVNGDGTINIGDPIALLGSLFSSPSPPPCADAADVNDDGDTNIADAVYGLSALFSGGDAPPPPFGACGLDPTADTLDCVTPPLCP